MTPISVFVRRIAQALLPLAFVFATNTLAEPLRVAVSPDYAPLMFKRDGQLVGIEADNAMEVGAILGRTLKIVEMPMREFIPALNDGRVDVVMSGFSITPERQAQVAFATPFMEIGQMAIIRTNDAARLAGPHGLRQPGLRVGVEPGTTGETYAREHFSEARILNYPNSSYAFAALRAGAADVYIHDAPTSWRLSNDRDNPDLISLYRKLTSENLAWAVRKDNVVLLGQLNAALAELRTNGRLRAIQNYWIPVTVQVR